MPEHLHLLLHLTGRDRLHRFLRRFRGRAAMQAIRLLKSRQDSETLEILKRHANGRSVYAFWKEKARALTIYQDNKAAQMVNYIHENPFRRGLVASADQWQFTMSPGVSPGDSITKE